MFLFLSPVAAAEPETVTLNLEGADINALITTVAEVTKKNFVVDPRVKGKVTVISSRPMDNAELYQVFLSILQVHGFAAVPSGDVIKILPDANAKQSSMPIADYQDPGVGDEIVTRIVQVTNVSAAQLVPLLRPLVPQQGHLAAYAPTNVLILSDRAANIGRLISIIHRIDQVSDSEVEVIPLRHASAAEVVRILSALERQPTKGQIAGQSPIVVADERTNSVLLSGDINNRLRIRTIITHLDTPLETGGNTHVIYLRYAKATDLVPVLTAISKTIQGEIQGGKQTAALTNNIGIQADESTNALVITAPTDVYESLQNVIRRLDIRRAQVLVDAVLAEVRSENLSELGIQWRTEALGSRKTFAGVNLPGRELGSLKDNESGTGPFRGFTLGYFSGGSLRALIRALADDGSTNFLGTPTLMTLDNEEAEIVVGQNIPIVTGQYTNDNTTPDNPFQTIERQDVGVLLKIKPQINEGNAVRLEIFQEISSVDEDTSGAGLITNKRSISTSVLVNDGQILVLGGLIQNDLQEDTQKVPVLGDIPVVGRLFRNKRVDNVQTNLMVFLKPTIIRKASEGTLVTHGKYNFIRNQQQQLGQPSQLVNPGITQPQLPPLGQAAQPATSPAQNQEGKQEGLPPVYSIPLDDRNDN